jgi:hypothetical protein
MSDMSVSLNNENQALLDKAKQDNERRLNLLREDFQKRETNIRESGEAAISHIKSTTNGRLDQAQTQSDQKLRSAKERSARDYGEIKRRSQQSNEVLDENMRSAESRASERINQAHKNEARVVEQTNAELRDFLGRQQELKAQARESTAKSIAKVRTEGNEQLAETKARSSEEIRRTDKKSKGQLSEIKERNKVLYNETKSEAERRIGEARRDADVKITQDQSQKNKSLRNMAIKYHEAATVEQRTGEDRLTDLKKRNQEQLEKLRLSDLERNRLIHDEYSEETQRIQKEGEINIKSRQDNFEALRAKQAESNQLHLQEIEENFSKEELELRKETEARMQHLSGKLDENLKQQRSDFKDRFEVNDKTFKGSLQNQKEGYLKALYRQKQKFDSRFSESRDRADDPFYRLKDFNARLDENPNSYVLKAKVAPFEKNSVDIIVKDNRITLSGRRAYADSFSDDAGDRSTTNSYQTYRQDFKLEIPVDGHLAIRKIENDGSITVVAPKKGHGKGNV